jgi:Rrf2 family protein
MLYLAKLEKDVRAATSQIADEQQIPPSFLAKIISQLSIAGLILTSRGARGGVTLARQAEEITLLDVVEAIDGPISLNVCSHSAGACPFGDDCPIQPIWSDAQHELVDKLRSTNFGQLIKSSKN